MEYEYIGIIKKVYDGDGVYHIDIDLGMSMFIKKSVRLARVDAPEMRGVHLEAGKIVRDFVRGLILDKHVVIKTYKDNTGAYGRLLADITIDGVDLALLLIDMGYAKPYKKGVRCEWTHEELNHIIKKGKE